MNLASKVSMVCLVLVWLFPFLSTLPTGVPADPGYLDSSRTLLTLLCLTAWLLSGLWKKESLKIGGVFGWAFLGWGLLSSLVSSHLFDSLLFWQTWVAASAVYAVGGRILPLPEDFEQRFFLLHLPAATVAIVSLLGLVEGTTDRVVGPFGLANVYSNWLLIFFPLMLLDINSAKGWKLGATMATCGICVASLLLTHSRGGTLLMALEIGLLLTILLKPTWSQFLVGCGVCGTLFALLLVFREELGGVLLLSGLMAMFLVVPLLFAVVKKQKELAFRVAIFLALAALVVGFVQHFSVVAIASEASSRMNRFVEVDNSTRTRGLLWQAAFQMTNDNPIFGVGPGGFSEAFPRYQPGYYVYSDSPHSSGLELSSELGWIGLALFLLFVGTKLASFTKGLINDPVRSACLLGLAIGSVQAQVDVTYQFAAIWTTFALVASWAETESADGTTSFLSLRLALCGLVLLSLSYLFYHQREYELILAEPHSEQNFEKLSQLVERFPYWSRPSLTFMERGVSLTGPEIHPVLPRLEPVALRAAQRFPENSRAQRLKAEVFRGIGRKQVARESFQRALELDPWNYPLSYYYLIGLCQSLNDQEAAIRWSEAALKAYPLKHWPRTHFGHRANLEKQLVALFLLVADSLSPYNEPKRTEPLFRFILNTELGKESPSALHGLGISLFTQGKLDEAFPLLEEAHQRNPLFPAPPYRPGSQ